MTKLSRRGFQVSLKQVGLNDEQIEDLRMFSPFSIEDLSTLVERFIELDARKKGFLTFDEYALSCLPFPIRVCSRHAVLVSVLAGRFMRLGEFRFNPLLPRIKAVLQQPRDGKITFLYFVQTLAVFGNASKAEKHKCTLRCLLCAA